MYLLNDFIEKHLQRVQQTVSMDGLINCLILTELINRFIIINTLVRTETGD